MRAQHAIIIAGLAGFLAVSSPLWLSVGYEHVSQERAGNLSGALLNNGADHLAAEQAERQARRAVAHLKEVGPSRAFADFSRRDGGFVEGDQYVFCFDHVGVVYAHGGTPSLVGRNLLNLRDPDGRTPVGDIVRFARERGEGWVEYKWPRPSTKRIESESAYVIDVEGFVCGVGYYRERPS